MENLAILSSSIDPKPSITSEENIMDIPLHAIPLKGNAQKVIKQYAVQGRALGNPLFLLGQGNTYDVVGSINYSIYMRTSQSSNRNASLEKPVERAQTSRGGT